MIRPLRFRSCVAAFAALVVTIPNPVWAQQLAKKVIASGGHVATSTNYGVRGTAGQAAIGTAATTTISGAFGYWYNTGEVVTATEPGGSVPLRFDLEQNFPNPFNPTTTIRFSLAKSGAVDLTVYDVRGRAVVTLIDETLSAGSHRIIVDATDFPSGVYWYRLTSNDATLVKKFVLLK